MDYDDELNDEEEKDYKKELMGSDSDNDDNDEEGEEDMEEESEESVVPEPKVLPKRSTRG